MQALQICIGPTIRISRESWCLPYVGFLDINMQDSERTDHFPDEKMPAMVLQNGRRQLMEMRP